MEQTLRSKYIRLLEKFGGNPESYSVVRFFNQHRDNRQFVRDARMLNRYYRTKTLLNQATIYG